MPGYERLRQFRAAKVARIERFTVRVLQQYATDRDGGKKDDMLAVRGPIRARVDTDQAGEGYLQPCFLASFTYRRLGEGFPRVDTAAGEPPDLKVFALDEQNAVIINDSNRHSYRYHKYPH